MSNGNGQILFRYYGNVLSMSQASATSDGWLSRIDWNRFNGAAGGSVSSVFGRSGAVTAQSSDYAAFYAPIGVVGLPAGGTIGQTLAKNSSINFDAGWVNPPVTTATEDQWSYSTNNMIIEPGAKKFRTNNAAFAAATAMAISVMSNQNIDRTGLLLGLQTGDVLFLQDSGNASNWARCTITATPINHTSWFEIPIAMVNGGGAPINNNSTVLFSFSQSGTGSIPVTSVFGRIGAVVAANGDYSFAQIGSKPTTLLGYGITDAQPLDGDLTSLASAAGTNTIYYRSAVNTWSPVTIGGNMTFSGGVLNSVATGGGGGGAPIVYLQTIPVSPTGTTSTSTVMAGLSGPLTPVGTGKVFVTVTGRMANDTVNNGAYAQLYYGPGMTGPPNGAAASGTPIGSVAVRSGGWVANVVVPFSVSAVIAGLTPGAPIWIDLGFAAITGGTASLSGVTIAAFELPSGTVSDSAFGAGWNGVADIAPSQNAVYDAFNFTNLAGTATTAQGGLPTGGTANQVLAKIDGANYNTQWTTPAGGGAVSSVFTRTGAVAAQSGDYAAFYMPASGIATDVTFGTVNIGSKARLVPLSNGVKLEVFDGSVWQTQAQWTE